LPSTEEEAEGLRDRWKVPSSKIRTLPNGIDERFFNATPSLFQEKFNAQGDFVLHVGRFHPVKNQKVLIRCLLKLGATAFFIGNPDLAHQDYYESCKNEAAKSGGKIRFISSLKHDDPLLASAYAAAKVFACPSLFETFGVAALEAAASGGTIVMTENTRAKEIFKSFSSFVNPQSSSDIAEKISGALKTKTTREDRRDLLKKYTWPEIARRLSKIYEEC
jgi:glycosyltransferase involved in cell wall biosynthesis